jgi:hypothetical protein
VEEHRIVKNRIRRIEVKCRGEERKEEREEVEDILKQVRKKGKKG